jgi:2,3-bisphosphoglycerate-independent phosphoglycerate mutase
MKYVVFLGDGMSDYPIKELGNKTPLQFAGKPNIDKIAAEGCTGLAQTVPLGVAPGSDVAGLSILGFDPKKYYTGRAPLEAASLGLKLEPSELVFRVNLVTIHEGVLEDYSAGHISSKEGAALIAALNAQTADLGVKFYSGAMYRNLMVVDESLLQEGRGPLYCTPPHDISGKAVEKYLPRGKGSKFLGELMRISQKVFQGHPINTTRLDLRENPATQIWFWGQGKMPTLPSFRERFGLNGGMISAVDLLKGLATCLGMEVLKVPGITGYYDTDYDAKARYALDFLKSGGDFIFVHVEATDEAGHNGDLREKIRAIENFDRKVVGKVMAGLPALGEYRVMVLPDHGTPIALKTHISDPVPFAMAGSGIEKDKTTCYDEDSAKKGKYKKVVGHALLDTFFESNYN